MRRKTRTPRRLLLRLTIIAGAGVTTLFVLSTLLIFGLSTHRNALLSWDSSSSNADLVQVLCVRGQFHLTINFLRQPQVAAPSEPRRWHAGVSYLPGVDLNVRVTDHAASRYGADIYFDRDGPRFYVGVFGLYPTLVFWGLVWLIARRGVYVPGHCPMCGYDIRATMERCPECGAAPENPTTADQTE